MALQIYWRYNINQIICSSFLFLVVHLLVCAHKMFQILCYFEDDKEEDGKVKTRQTWKRRIRRSSNSSIRKEESGLRSSFFSLVFYLTKYLCKWILIKFMKFYTKEWTFILSFFFCCLFLFRLFLWCGFENCVTFGQIRKNRFSFGF